MIGLIITLTSAALGVGGAADDGLSQLLDAASREAGTDGLDALLAEAGIAEVGSNLGDGGSREGERRRAQFGFGGIDLGNVGAAVDQVCSLSLSLSLSLSNPVRVSVTLRSTPPSSALAETLWMMWAARQAQGRRRGCGGTLVSPFLLPYMLPLT